MITVDQALAIVLQRIEALPIETVPLERALGRVLCEPVYADIDLPPFNRARMDGYAVRSSDVADAPVMLRVIGEVSAGASFPGKLNPGEAVKIFTGAPVPEGADAVQKIEVTRSTNHTVEIKEAVKPGQFITPLASEVATGEQVLNPGRAIGPAEMAVL
ncbi:MAG TPA: molybdopterin molybdenumtransferase MoeA, partial [Blastocatellia bacterium]|nr:molybdopterin molybdenumtransferase MoeA [Blastocatellia bacterium]